MAKPQDISSGNTELDHILAGGLTPSRVYLFEGDPGTGKTTLALEFLLEGARQGESGLYVSLSETKSEVEAVAESHGWTLENITVYELVDPSATLDADSQYTMFQPSEVELGQTTQALLTRVEEVNPSRVVLDSLSELRLLSQNPLRYRRHILALKQYFVSRGCTAVFLDDKTSPDNDLQLQSIAHGVVSLECMSAEYGDERRRLRVVKYRGRQFAGGWHDFEILPGGLQIYSRITAQAVQRRRYNTQELPATPLLSGNTSLDELLGDGIHLGTSTLMLGPAGVGKSSCSTLYVTSACMRGERAVIYAFDESRKTLLKRSLGLGMDLEKFEDDGLLEIHQIDPGETTPGEFAWLVRQSVKPSADGKRVSVVVIDSLNGYLSAMPEERFLQVQMHEMLAYLAGCDIATFLVVAQHGMLGSTMQTPVDASYLADTVMLFRYFESTGEIRQAVSIVKKRSGQHERTIREFRMADGKILVGKPLREFHGILSGTPRFSGDDRSLMRKRGDG